MSEDELQTLCAKLWDLLQYEMNTGNRIIAIDTGWSNVKLAVRLARPLDMEHVRKVAEHNRELEIWESHDIKNLQESGILCRSHRQTLSGPIK